MRVLTIGNLYPPAAQGGYERIWAGAVAALRAAGHEVRILTTVPTRGATPEHGFPSGEPGIARSLEWYWEDFAFRELGDKDALALERRNAAVLERELSSFAPDVVSWWGMGGMSLSLIEQVRRRGVPAVGLVADGWMGYAFEADAWISQFAGAAAGRRARALAAVRERSAKIPTRIDLEAAADWLFISRAVARSSPIPSEDPMIAYPGVDPERFAFAEPDPEFRWRLLCIGRIEPVKGVGDAIRALAAMPAAARLTIDGAGDEAHIAELRGLAEELGVAGQVTWQRSPPDALGEVYAAHDVTLFPVTWEEPWGLVPLESMSVGRPVVGTAGGGTKEYLVDGLCGLVVRPGRPRELASACIRLANDPDLRARLVEGGRVTASRYTEEGFNRRVIIAHEKAAARSRQA